MPLGFGRPKTENVVSLIAAKRYGQAIEILRAQLEQRGASSTLRKQLADVLVLAGKEREAVALLIPLADQFAREGFAAKAVSILKKIQKIDPGRRDVDERLARLIEEKQREAVVLPVSPPPPTIDMEEIGIEPPPSGPIDIPVVPAPAEPEPTPAVDAGGTGDGGAELELGLGGAPISTSAEDAAAPPDADPAPAPEASIPAPLDEAAPIPVAPPDPTPLSETSPDATLPLSSVPGLAGGDAGALWLKPEADTEAPEAEAVGEIEDYDLLYVPEESEEEEQDAEVEVELELLTPAPESPDEVMSDGAFADELMGLVDSMFQESSEGTFELPAPEVQKGPQRTGDQIVVSPLFRDFSVDEMVAVIAGLKLLAFERGEVILREGQPGGSLYMLTHGRVRAFRKDPRTSKQAKIGDLTEGAFFGEMSILTGQPRAASIVALNSCELLELDRPTLDEITKSHPHVWDVLREFAEKRSAASG